MSNYKVKVNNEAESKEVQELFFELGYGFEGCKNKSIQDFEYVGVYYLFAYIDGDLAVSSDKELFDFKDSHKEITLPQLKDLVVLKRNDVDDRNVIDPEDDANLYLDSYNKLFVFHIPTQTWKESNLNGEEEVMQRLKPIEKPMKEYLKIYDDGSCILMDGAGYSGQDDWVEVPEGATFYAEDSNMGVKGNYFFKLRSDDFDAKAIYLNGNWMRACFDVRNMTVLWQRHTQPEELLFMDDEPKSLNSQYAEIEKVRQSIKSDGGSSEYHQRKIPKKMLKRWKKTGNIEVKDVIRLFLNNDFTRGNIFKAHSRISSLENGQGKEGASKEYDLNKVLYFAQDDVKSNK